MPAGDLTIEIGSQPVSSALAAEAGLLVPAEGRGGVEERLKVLAQTTPARSRFATDRIREPFSLQMPADSP